MEGGYLDNLVAGLQEGIRPRLGVRHGLAHHQPRRRRGTEPGVTVMASCVPIYTCRTRRPRRAMPSSPDVDARDAVAASAIDAKPSSVERLWTTRPSASCIRTSARPSRQSRTSRRSTSSARRLAVRASSGADSDVSARSSMLSVASSRRAMLAESRRGVQSSRSADTCVVAWELAGARAELGLRRKAKCQPSPMFLFTIFARIST